MLYLSGFAVAPALALHLPQAFAFHLLLAGTLAATRGDAFALRLACLLPRPQQPILRDLHIHNQHRGVSIQVISHTPTPATDYSAAITHTAAMRPPQ
jgi:hypothetical protein